MHDEITEPYKKLANAIISRAIIDLKRASKRYLCNNDTAFSDRTIRETLNFFYSDYFQLLTDAEPSAVVRCIVDGLINRKA